MTEAFKAGFTDYMNKLASYVNGRTMPYVKKAEAEEPTGMRLEALDSLIKISAAPEYDYTSAEWEPFHTPSDVKLRMMPSGRKLPADWIVDDQGRQWHKNDAQAKKYLKNRGVAQTAVPTAAEATPPPAAPAAEPPAPAPAPVAAAPAAPAVEPPAAATAAAPAAPAATPPPAAAPAAAPVAAQPEEEVQAV